MDMTLETQQTEDHDPRRAVILAAAMEVFARYGFRRTSMEDIATTAGLSRTALYQYYRNKQDIFRSLVGWYFDQAQGRVAAALVPGAAPEAALAGAFAAKLGPELKVLFDSPHGEELLDVNSASAADIVTRGEDAIARLLADWLAGEAAAGRIVLLAGDAEGLARVMVGALGGLKAPGKGYDEITRGMAQLAALFGRGLKA